MARRRGFTNVGLTHFWIMYSKSTPTVYGGVLWAPYVGTYVFMYEHIYTHNLAYTYNEQIYK